MSNPQIKIKKMKKFLFSLGLIAMAFNLTNCAQHEEATPITAPQGDFELFASNASIARTTNDDKNTLWATGDALNVFHAVTDMTEYTLDGKFTLASGSTDRFTGDLNGELDPQEEYDWYVIYPYQANRTSPTASDKKGYTGVGCFASSTQKQDGYNSTKHLSGVDFPIAGVKKAVSAASAPTVAMKNLASVLAFNITNTIDAEVVVKSVTFTAPESIIGTYYINFTDIDNVEFTDSGDNYVSKSATVKVSNGTALAKGALATVYMGIKPFTAAAGSEFTVSVTADVNGVESVYTKTVNSEKGIKFSSNTIKSFPVNFEAEIPSAEDIVEVIDFSKQDYANAQAISSFDGNFCSIAFDKGTNSTAPAYYTTGSAVRVYAGSYFTITSEQTIIGVAFTFGSGEDNTAAENNALSADSGSIANNAWTGEANSIKFTVAGTKGHRRIQKLQITYKVTDPAIIVNPISVAATGAEGEATYSVLKMEDDVTATFATEWISAEAGNGKITYEIEPNYTGAVRVGEITLASASAGITKSVVVEQAADVFNVNLAEIELGANANSTAKFTVNSTYPFSITNPDSTKLSFSPTSGEGTVEITVTALTANSNSEALEIGNIVVSRSVDSKTVSVAATQVASGTVEKVPTDATLSFANKAQRTTYDSSKQVWEQNGIVLTNNKASSTSNVADYANPARFYANSSIEITAPGQITKIVYTANSSSYATTLKSSIGTVSGATVAASGSTVTVTYSTPVDKITINKLSEQVRMNSLTVTYLK